MNYGNIGADGIYQLGSKPMARTKM